VTLSISSAESIIEAEKSAPNNASVFVGYMRRYAASFEAFKREIATTMPVFAILSVKTHISLGSQVSNR
jgi:predicted dehydrogenase